MWNVEDVVGRAWRTSICSWPLVKWRMVLNRRTLPSVWHGVLTTRVDSRRWRWDDDDDTAADADDDSYDFVLMKSRAVLRWGRGQLPLRITAYKTLFAELKASAYRSTGSVMWPSNYAKIHFCKNHMLYLCMYGNLNLSPYAIGIDRCSVKP